MMNAVGIDVSKGKSTVTIRRPGDEVILPPCDVRHTRSSIDTLINEINQKLETGWFRAFNAIDILRMLGFNENALTERVDDDETMQKMLMYGISGNARKVPDPEMRKLKVTKLRGYKKVWDVARNMEVYEPCMRLDFNFYPLEGKI